MAQVRSARGKDIPEIASAPVSPRPYYTAKEVAQLVGIAYDSFLRMERRTRLHVEEQLPRPYVARPMKFDRASIDAWRSRYHPAATARPANDLVSVPPASSDQDHQAELFREYGQRRVNA